MDKEAIEGYETPLEQALADLSQEEAPEGLHDRCLAALDEAAKGTGQGKREGWEVWRQLVTAAAILVMLAGVFSAISPGSHTRPENRKTYNLYSNEPPLGLGRALAPATPAGPAPLNPEVGVTRATPKELEALREARRFARDKIAEAAGAPGGPSVASPPVGKPQSEWRPRGSGSAAPPWRDESGQRRKMTERTVEMDVPEVEEAYKQAVGIIEKAGGFVLNEELTVRDRGQDQVRLFCKIPSEQFEGVLAQVRGLGKIVLVTGQSQDMTLQYEEEGADVRVMAAEIE
ncbi:MAG: DUF4349 domain-containing protein, partial [Armatimonadia bacterium]